MTMLADVTQGEVALFGAFFLVAFLGVIALFFFAGCKRRHPSSLSPYTGLPLRRASDISFESKKRVLQFLHDRQEYDNRIFTIKSAALCRETGRLFPKSITWLDTIHVDWGFLRKRYPGNYVSWGSLDRTEQERIREAHVSLEGFQTEYSSPKPLPREIEEDYAYAKPGPLYVDIDTGVLLGWQCVPNTPFEVLIVQKPKPR
jgi:hypothetical protein